MTHPPWTEDTTVPIAKKSVRGINKAKRNCHIAKSLFTLFKLFKEFKVSGNDDGLTSWSSLHGRDDENKHKEIKKKMEYNNLEHASTLRPVHGYT